MPASSMLLSPLTLMLSAGETSGTFMLDVLIILATATLVAIALQRIRMAVIPAYLIAGALAGPYALKLVRTADSLSAISGVAIVLLMFGIGLHLHLSALGRGLARMIAIGAISTLTSMAAIWPLAVTIGLPAPAAIAVSMALSCSSTAVVLRLIADRGELKHATGRLALAILVVQDMMVIPMLAAIPLLSQWAGGAEFSATTTVAESPLEEVEQAMPPVSRFLFTAILRIGGIALLILGGRILLPRLLSESAREKSGEVMMVASLATALGAGIATQAIGLSAELGAFLAGFILAASPFRHQLSGQIAPLRDLFMAVFFTTLGMRLDVRLVAEHWWVILLGGAFITAVKALSIGGVAWAFGATPSMAVALGFALAQGGEFGLVLLGAANTRGIIDERIVTDIAAIIVISLILTPALVDIGRRWSKRWQRVPCAPWITHSLDAADTRAQPRSAQRLAVVGGFGQVGRRVVQSLEEAGMRCAIVELNSACVREHSHNGRADDAARQFIFGDVANAEVLTSAGIEDADALILTMPDEEPAMRACVLAKRLRPSIFIAARLTFATHERMARDLGADVVIVEELETARRMQEAVREHLGVAPPTVTDAPQSPAPT